MASALGGGAEPAAGMFCAEAAGVFLAWSVRPGSFAGCMPAWNEKRDCLLVFAGEHFGDKGEVEALKGRHHQVKGWSAAHLIHAYEESGPDFLLQLNGVYAGVVVDFRNRTGFLFNDRFGLQRVFTRETADAFYFSTDLFLLAGIAGRASVDEERACEWLRHGSVCDNGTIFAGIDCLAPASAVGFGPDPVLRKRAYFTDQEWLEQPYLGFDFFRRQLGATIARILPRYFRSQGNPALCLGGVGSCLILSQVGEMAAGRVPFFAGGGYRDGRTGCEARLAERFGQQLMPCENPKEYVAEFPRLLAAAVRIAGCNVDAAASLSLHRASTIATRAGRAVIGDLWADLFTPGDDPTGGRDDGGGAMLHQPATGCRPGDAGTTAPEADPLSSMVRGGLQRRRAAWHAVAAAQVDLGLAMLDRDVVALLYRVPRGTGWAWRAVNEILAEDRKGVREVLRRGGSRLSPGKGGGDDWAALVGGDGWRATGRQAHWWSRSFPGGHQVGQSLSGVVSPRFSKWFRDELSGAVRDILLDPQTLTRSFLDPHRVKACITEHCEGRRDHTLAISRTLAAEMALRAALGTS